MSRANILEPIHIKYITYQLCDALSYLHRNEVVHSNLKVRSYAHNGRGGRY